MNTTTREELWDRLREQALVDGELPAVSAEASPWYVRVMLGVAGWIGALFLMIFVGIAFASIIKSAGAAMFVGLLGCGAACAIFHAARDNDFANQFGLAVSLAGQGLFMVGLGQAFRFDTTAAFLAVAAFEIALALLVPNLIHRVLTSGGAAIALSFALERMGAYGIAPAMVAAAMAWVWLGQQRWAGKGELWRPIGYGLTLALLQIEAMGTLHATFRHIFASEGSSGAYYAAKFGAVSVGAVLVWTVARLLAREQIESASRAGMAALVSAILVGVVALAAPGVAAALLILVLGFSCANRLLMGLGVIALLGFVSHYYYQMQTTLLMKSAVLAASGVALLIARAVLHQWFSSDQEASHA